MSDPSPPDGRAPRIAMVLGDPAGIGPEITAKLLAAPENRRKAAILLVADRDELQEGVRIAGVELPFIAVNDPAQATPGHVALWDRLGGAAKPFERRKVTANGGRYALGTLRECLDLAQRGQVDAICFAPLNKASLHLAGMGHSDELHWFAELLGHTGATSEFNVCDGLWTCRVTSHIALKDVAAQITQPAVIGAIRLIHGALLQAGLAQPRIAVCGLNPHNGDNGAFGREEIEVIGPAVEEAKRLGLPAEGPYPADTIFLRAKEVDAIVTMYHDQGQIAMKLMGFWRGVTVAGGLPVPITTCAHGSGFDIQGQGIARVGALQAAYDLACDMGARRARG
ncbi:4-hydroxythreonine-4-phosphate dehydrogenase PdxA [Roseomonas hellenica]|uniref:4-hydroxythreonine-4-phosphate dehydrogenase PdxA n=1 Tax=Plastoroseomonas hellenica TaxID=2687306 RepID=A0ABS5EXZ1_9PROT|nr:4-hydroxythreonine-4-phosphate dehydrogenase PdxA [Plastoroseomonas hellenica]MBR0665166.1 4-hydroxythreonine-4-phosphate dehydrogenase PdxA [Plastoroseomonas hellenica]